ncbi:hypothetical protein INS49_000955 [Diaporthe citri]|uniref:uncharacterized protein n=1 Tax=Diaporthe citri TaxID=83186 RepID=UPI001C81CE95|nr:uncharacterized protein INS49_000955 [Diaporthe citri]KAG6366775.1 hypothetical protein INS49_000955 [Diaporthe citri]
MVVPTERLIELMEIQPLSPYQDRDDVLRKGRTMSPVFLGRGRYILATPQFQQFLSAPTSGVLLVDGHSTLANNPAIMVLHFFVGQHSLFDDPVRGPGGLMRSLIYQVLLYPNQPSACLDQFGDQAVQDIADGDIGTLCWLFRELLKRVVNVKTIL